MLWLTKPTSIIGIVTLFLVIMHAYPVSIFIWFLAVVGSLPVILLVHIR